MRPAASPDLPFTIDRSSGVGVLAQLTSQLRGGVHSGLLLAGDPLPATRALAAALGVSRGTVVSAYEQLVGEGYFISRQGAGTVVAEVPGIALPARASADPGPAAAPAPTTPPLDVTPGRPGTSRLPHADWSAAVRAGAAAALPSDEPPPAGISPLREQIADHLRRARGLACSADDILVTAGTSDALLLITLLFAELRGRAPRIAVEDPGYPTARAILSRLGAQLVPIPVDGSGLEHGPLADAAPVPDAVLVTPSHQYPTGGRLEVSRRLQLLQWAAGVDSFVVEDDYDSEFRHVGAPVPAIAALDTTSRVLHIGSFSKILSPWLRCGYLVLPRDAPALRAAAQRVRRELGTPVSGISQLVLARYLESGGLRRHIARTRRDYAHKRRLILDGLAGLSTDVRLTGLDGGLHAVVEFPDSVPSSDVAAALADRGFQVAELREYSATSATVRNGIVVGYGAVTDLQLTAVLSALLAVVRTAAAPDDTS